MRNLFWVPMLKSTMLWTNSYKNYSTIFLHIFNEVLNNNLRWFFLPQDDAGCIKLPIVNWIKRCKSSGETFLTVFTFIKIQCAHLKNNRTQRIHQRYLCTWCVTGGNFPSARWSKAAAAALDPLNDEIIKLIEVHAAAIKYNHAFVPFVWFIPV